MLTPGQVVALTIEKPAAGGRMIARADGQVVLVAGAIPGEVVQARVARVGKGVAYAETIDVETPSVDRRASDVDPACGGCLYAHIEYPRQLQIKSLVIADAFRRIGRLTLPADVQVAPSPEEGYRMRARFHVRDGTIGFYREGTHELCDPRQTGQLLPATMDVLDSLSAAMAPLRGEAIREIVLAENIDAGERVIAIDAVSPIDSARLAPLAAVDGLTGILASDAVVRGRPLVMDRIEVAGQDPISLQRHVQAFFQGNRFLFQPLVTHVLAQVPEEREVLDLYAGGGAFAVSVAAGRMARVTAVEGDRVAASDLVANCAAAGAVVTPERESVEVFLQKYRQRPDVVIVDPPRTGMSRAALEGVRQLRAARVIYVSCDVPTLARDARGLIDAGYAIDRADAFDLFPNTPHIETVVVFTRI